MFLLALNPSHTKPLLTSPAPSCSTWSHSAPPPSHLRFSSSAFRWASASCSSLRSVSVRLASSSSSLELDARNSCEHDRGVMHLLLALLAATARQGPHAH